MAEADEPGVYPSRIVVRIELKRGKKKPDGYRMACQALVNGDCSVKIP